MKYEIYEYSLLIEYGYKNGPRHQESWQLVHTCDTKEQARQFINEWLSHQTDPGESWTEYGRYTIGDHNRLVEFGWKATWDPLPYGERGIFAVAVGN